MSLTSALGGAMSGMAAMAKSASVVSDNIANALTEGYARREVELSSRVAGGQGNGVTVTSVDRIVSKAIIAGRRDADADAAAAGVAVDFLNAVWAAIGEPGTGNSLSDGLTALESALVEAAARPDSETGLQQVLDAFQDVVARVNAAGNQIQTLRTDADRTIARDVAFLNDALADVAELNADIRRLSATNGETGALIDQRQLLVDQISEIVPVREIERDDGTVSLMTEAGVALLDGTPAEIGFTPATLVTEHHSLAGGTLSGISVNGREIDLTRSGHGLSGGSLAARFAVRDEIAPEAQANLDAFARDLAERFQSATVDPTLGAGSAGLLTDGGDPVAAGSETGLSRRLAVNSAVIPADGGAIWRLRDGLGAATQGDSGQSAGLTRLGDALTELRVPVSGALSTVARSASGLASDLLSAVGAELQSGETRLARTQARADALRTQELADGVDSDQEMQRLLVIEQAYAANARVVQAVEAMLDTLMEI